MATGRNNLAVLLQDLGDLPAARVLLEQALASDRKTYGDDHPEVATDRNNLALRSGQSARGVRARINVMNCIVSKCRQVRSGAQS